MVRRASRISASSEKASFSFRCAKTAPRWVVVQVAIQKPGFFEEAGLLWAKLYHYPALKITDASDLSALEWPF